MSNVFDFNDGATRDDSWVAPTVAASHADANPANGARALDLSAATGVPAPAVYANLDGFEKRTKAEMASSIVRGNPALTEYIRNNAMGAIVSNDDYGNLDKISKGLIDLNTGPLSIAAALVAHAMPGIGAIKESFGSADQPINYFTPEETAKYPMTSSALNLVLGSGDLAMRLGMVPVIAGAYSLGNTLDVMRGVIPGLDKVVGSGEQLRNDLLAMPEAFAGMMGGGGAHAIVEASERQKVATNIARLQEATVEAKKWTDAGLTPPRGLHPVFDQIYVEANAIDVEKMSQTLDAAQESFTKERNPELFQKFVEQHNEGKNIGITADAIGRLYGDKVPSLDDGLLGWVPGIGQKIALAKSTGADVNIPLGDWLSKIDPAVAKGLMPDIRMFPDGITETEAKSPITTHAVVDSPLAQVRDVAGLEPAFGLGDRKLTIEPGEGGLEIKSPIGESLGKLTIEDGKITSAEGHVGALAETIGPSAMRDLERQIQAEHPEVKVTPEALKQAWEQGQSAGDETSAGERLDALRGSAAGLPIDSFRKLVKSLDEQHAEDLEAATKRAQAEQKKKLSKEWKDTEAEVRQQVGEDIRKNPVVAADLFVGSGELAGEKLRQRAPLFEGDLTAEQKASLPDHYYSKSGAPVDAVAKLFGFPSGDMLVDALAKHTAERGELSPQQMLRKMVNAETEKRMQAKFGSLEDNIIHEAIDQALSETNLNRIAEEYYGAAMQAGVETIDRDLAKLAVKNTFESGLVRDVNFNQWMALSNGHYQKAVTALIGKDYASAVISLQKRMYAAMMAAETRKFEKEVAKNEKVLNGYTRPWDPAKNNKVEADASLFIRDMLAKIQRKNGLTPAGLIKGISESEFTDLNDYVAKTEKFHELEGIQFPIPPEIMKPDFSKATADMSVAEYREIMGGIIALDRFGRDQAKVLKNGEAWDRKELIRALNEQIINKFTARDDARAGALETAIAVSTNNETLMSRFDDRDPHGLFTETFTYPGARAANDKFALEQAFGKMYTDLGPIKDRDRTLPSPFRNPVTGKVREATRETLAVVISNMGNEYNWKTLTTGWKVNPEALWQWVEKHSTPEDFERAQKLGRIFKEAKRRADVVYAQMYGRSPENITVRPFTMHGQEWEGWYHPIIGDDSLSKYVNKMPEGSDPSTFWPSTSNSYQRRRTGATQVIDLSYDMVPVKLNQVLHEIAYKEFVANTAKVFRDNSFRQTVTNYYGKVYMENMDNWLKAIAGDASYVTGAMKTANKILNTVRENIISTAIAFNPSTIEKHGATAFAYSIRELDKNLIKGAPEFFRTTLEVAPSLFAHAVRDLFHMDQSAGDSIFKFIRENSEEIQRRDRDMFSTMAGQQDIFTGKSTLRKKVIQYGGKLVGLSDMLSAAPLWLAVYRREIASGAVEGAAVDVANSAVRRAHGSTAITNLPQIAAGTNGVTKFMTSLYGFMGTSMQRRIEIFHDINDAYNLGMKGEIKTAASKVPQILSGLAIYVLWTGYVEEKVAGQFTDDRRGPLEKTASFLFGSVANSVIGLRDIVNDLEHGSDSVGLLGSPIHDMAYLWRDLRKVIANKGIDKRTAGALVEHGMSVIGDMYGISPRPIGRMMHYGIDAFDGFQHPRTGMDVVRGMMTGKQQPRIVR